MRSQAIGLVVGAVLLSLSSRASADPPSPSKWDESWPRVSVVEVSVSAGLGIGAYVGAAVVDTSGGPRWTRAVLFDDGARDVLRVSSKAGQDRATGISDVMLYTLLAAPPIDAALSWGLQDDRDTALQLALIDAQAYLLTDATISLLKNVIRRERPDAAAAGCETRPNDPDCAKAVGKLSFPSRHAGLSFAAASLLCTEHLNLALVGAPGDALVCATSLAAATTVSLLRVVGDKHWTSDILAGAAIGGLYGWLMPTLLHFGRSSSTAKTTTSDAGPRLVSIAPVPLPGGALATGVFVY
jgi:membrane-associated phospholipid phosphatase